MGIWALSSYLATVWGAGYACWSIISHNYNSLFLPFPNLSIRSLSLFGLAGAWHKVSEALHLPTERRAKKEGKKVLKMSLLWWRFQQGFLARIKKKVEEWMDFQVQGITVGDHLWTHSVLFKPHSPEAPISMVRLPSCLKQARSSM